MLALNVLINILHSIFLVLVETDSSIFVHSGEEDLGFSGSVSLHAVIDEYVLALIGSEGSKSRLNYREFSKVLSNLSAMAYLVKMSTRIIGVADVKLLDESDNFHDSSDRLDLIKLIYDRVLASQADCVYGHHFADLNIDYRFLVEPNLTGCPFRFRKTVKGLLSSELACSAESYPPESAPSFQPNWLVYNLDDMPRNRVVKKTYYREIRPWPYAYSSQVSKHRSSSRLFQAGRYAADSSFLLSQFL